MASAELEAPQNPLPPFIYRLLPELAYIGDEAKLDGQYLLDGFSKGAMQVSLPDGIAYELRLTNTGSGVLLMGSASAEALTDCTRCLEQAHVSLAGEVEAYYILNPEEEDLEAYDDSAVVVDSTGMVDLAVPITASLVSELPFVVLCQDDCAGLCPGCGENLNTDQCTCPDEPDPDHPFAALRSLFDEPSDGG